jgi:hypothetical protein
MIKSVIALILLLILSAELACHNKTTVADLESEQSSEPERYAAKVVYTVEDEQGRRVSESRVVRSADLLREEWNESGETKVMLWRPDMGKSFLLFPQRREYVETAIADTGPDESFSEIERWFYTPPAPISLETVALANCELDGHPCKVLQQRASFADGHIEVKSVFRALDLSGLALRIETETIDGNSRIKVIVERRNVTTEVSPEEFNVPSNFKKVATPR